MRNFEKVRHKLEALHGTLYEHNFDVPGLWLEKFDNNEISVSCDPFDFFINRFNRIEELAKHATTQESKHPTVYNMLVRYATAYDHSFAGNLQNIPNAFKSSGTFLKAIAILPYIKRLGVDTVYLLPITSIGKDGNKGDLGSPYSIRNAYRQDENLSEPLLGMTIEEQFSAFIEAAHSLGMKVILEFVFRTASLDSEMALQHPNWFYWIKETDEPFRPPAFSDELLEEIKSKIQENDLTELPAPEDSYIERFQPTPVKVEMRDGKVQGVTEDGTKVQIPNAFADWPPDDTQPLWTDVTYLKLYDHPDFNYIAYNTIRMYDVRLAQEEFENKDLWEYIANIIPHYIINHSIDGVMIDMGHALPSKLRTEIVERARSLNSDFIFWEENFVVHKKSKDEGYDAVLGYMPFDFHIPWKLREVIGKFEEELFPIDFFLTAETHNTKRTVVRDGNVDFSKAIWAISTFLPTIRFIHNGFELGESIPVNTGLGFEPEDIELLPPEKLPLFSSAVLNWHESNDLIEYILRVNQIKEKIEATTAGIDESIKLLHTNNELCIAFLYKESILICCNFSTIKSDIEIHLTAEKVDLELFEPEVCPMNFEHNILKVALKPFQTVIARVVE